MLNCRQESLLYRYQEILLYRYQESLLYRYQESMLYRYRESHRMRTVMSLVIPWNYRGKRGRVSPQDGLAPRVLPSLYRGSLVLQCVFNVLLTSLLVFVRYLRRRPPRSTAVIFVVDLHSSLTLGSLPNRPA